MQWVKLRFISYRVLNTESDIEELKYVLPCRYNQNDCARFDDLINEQQKRYDSLVFINSHNEPIANLELCEELYKEYKANTSI